jgi:hypothetical protein
MSALEAASVEQDIGPFTTFVAQAVSRSAEEFG